MRLPQFAENFLFKTNKVLGLEINILNDTEVIINCCICERSGSKILVPFSKSGLTSIDQLIKHIPKKDIPVCLILTGKGVMNKKITLSENESVSSAFHKVFPTGNENDFFTQVYYGLGNSGFCSIIRVQKVDQVIQSLSSAGLQVIDLFLGPFVIENSFVLNGDKGGLYEMEVAGHKLTVEDRKIVQCELGSEGLGRGEFNMSGLMIQGDNLLSFCGALSYFISIARFESHSPVVEVQNKEFGNNLAFKKGLVVALGFLLLVSVVNFLFYFNYFDKQKKLDSELSSLQGNAIIFEKLSKELNDKKMLLEKSGMGISTRASYFTDRLLYDIPEEIQLTYMSIFPVKSRIEKDSLIQFENKKIVVKGFCEKSIILNNWINLIKTKDFVKETVMNYYEQDADVKSGKFDLTINLK
ncbi:MAG: hypothetical protein ACXVNM_07200 [Bacteroidia bacterium]